MIKFFLSPLRICCLLGALLLPTAIAHAKPPTTAKPPTPALAAPAPPAIHSPAYYFTADLDPRYQFVGTSEMSEEQAATSNCYRFVYNPEGKLQQIQYRRAGVPMADPLFGVAQIDFEYAPGIERRTFHDAHGNPMANADGVYGEELTLNAAGFPTADINLDEAGKKTRDANGVIQYVRTLDEYGRLILGRRVGLFGTPITDENGFFETHTAYDAQGHPVERGNFDNDGKPLNDGDGVAMVRTAYTVYPDSTQTIETYFDASGLPANEKSDGVHQRQRTTDKRGFPLDETYFDAGGAPISASDDDVHERRYTYDDRGNELTEEFLGADGRPVNQKGSEFAKVIYKYDDKNRVIEKEYFGDDGTPQIIPSVGAAMVRQSYNRNGDLVRREFLDGQGHPSVHVQYGSPAIRIKVEGDTTFVTLRNGDDQPMRNPVNGYYAFSYKTATDKPLTRNNIYYDRHGRHLSNLRVFIINPHLYMLRTTRSMKWSARLGTAAAGLGALLACLLALRKSSHTKRRKVYVPSPLERFLGWFSVFAILEGMLRFFMTIYWAWISYQNGSMGYAFNVLETIFILFFLYRLYRMTLTMRVLDIEQDDLHRLVRNFFEKAGLKPEWIESRNRYVTPPLDVRVNYFRQKYHAYLAFTKRGAKGRELARDTAAYIRAQVGGILAPARTRSIAAYYPSVAFCYFLLSGTAFYTLYQVLKGY